MSPADDDHQRLRDDGKQAQAYERKAEESEADTLKERRHGRIGDESPVEVARIAEELEFVAVKAVAAVGGEVDQRDGGGDGKQGHEFGAAA